MLVFSKHSIIVHLKAICCTNNIHLFTLCGGNYCKVLSYSNEGKTKCDLECPWRKCIELQKHIKVGKNLLHLNIFLFPR